MAALTGSCTDVGIYAIDGYGSSGPDRTEFEGTACVPLAGGEAFPIRVLYVVEGGSPPNPVVVGQMTEALQSLVARFSQPFVKFGLVGFHSVATGLQGSFVDATAFGAAIPKYTSYTTEGGPVSVRAGLKLAKSILSGDMQSGCRGIVARTRYLVVVVFYSHDLSCVSPAFNAGISNNCASLPADQCSACELDVVTNEIKALAEQYHAGDVTVQPVVVRDTVDPTLSLQGQAIARAGGTDSRETDPNNIKTALNNLDYSSLQRALVMKRFIAFNRNVVSREGQMFTDSDGDGVPDDDETCNNPDPAAYDCAKLSTDTDNDGLMDGIELKLGMNPLVLDTINGCNPYLDTDGDRLNDCEEKVLGTDPCISDSDGDGMPELVEVLAGTNPLVPEDLNDDDRDGLANVEEIRQHTDSHSADIAFQTERGYRYFIDEGQPTADGRACYDFRVINVSLVPTLNRPNPNGPSYPGIPKGTNDVYLYLEVGRPNDPHGTGIGSLSIEQIQFIPPNKKRPKGVIVLTPDSFVLGS